MLALVLALLFGGPVLSIPHSYLYSFIGSQERAEETTLEEFLCLLGKKGKITAVIKPRQRAWIEYDDFGRPAWSLVTHEPCPKGTIADFHTHPWGQSAPSEKDLLSASFQTYPYHLIMYKTKSGSYGITAYTLARYLEPGEVVFE